MPASRVHWLISTAKYTKTIIGYRKHVKNVNWKQSFADGKITCKLLNKYYTGYENYVKNLFITLWNFYLKAIKRAVTSLKTLKLFFTLYVKFVIGNFCSAW